MKVSFRTRLFVIASLIVATVLATLMFIGWSRVLAFEVERLDDRLCLEARRLATQPLRGERMEEMESDVAEKLHLSSNEQMMLEVTPGGSAPALRSTHWSDSVETEKLIWTSALRQPDPVRSRGEAQDESPRERNEAQREPLRTDGRYRPIRGVCSLASSTDQTREWRAAKYDLSNVANPGGRSIIAADLAATKQELQSAVKSALAIVVPVALVLAALGAWLLSSLAMRPVNRLRAAMQGVTRNALDQRLSAQNEDREFAELIEAYNTMLQRLEASFHQASRFSADAAHELRTPLTILQGRIEQAVNMTNHRTIQSDLVGMLDEVGRMSAITRKLLLLSRVDAGRLALHLEPINLTAMLDTLMADAQLLAENQLLECAIERHLEIEGDELLLRQLFNNLISNAARYCPSGGWIKVTADARSGGIELLFSNRSHAIAAEDRSRFFDRFYRGDAAHNRKIDGSGLGLSLAREIARAHGGDMMLLASPIDEVTIALWLPASPCRR